MTSYTRILIPLFGAVAVVLEGARDGDVYGAVSGTPSVSTTGHQPVTEHANPRLKLSYRHFNVTNLDLTDLPLQGLQLDVYPLSRRWLRGGIELEAGTGRAALSGGAFNIRYAMAGVTGGFQFPARITPFVEGRLVGGIMNGIEDGVITIPGTSVAVTGISGTTWLTGRGLDFGAEFFVTGRAYVSASIGWLRTTWGGVDYPAMLRDPSAGVRFKDLSNDGFTFKLGLGI